MTRIKRHAAAAGAAALLAVSLSACGGASAAPTDASEEEFCDAFNAVFEPLGEGEPTEEEFGELQDRVEELGEVGTPEDIDEEEREGFELFVDAIADADYDDVKDLESDASFPGLSDEEDQKVEDFFSGYALETCGGAPDSEETPAE